MSHNVTSSASSGPRLNEWSKSGMTAAARLTQLQQQQQQQQPQQQQQGASHGVQESTIVSPPPKGNKNRSRRGSHLSSKPGAATPSMNAVPRSPNPEPCSGSQQDPAQQGASVGAVEPVTPPVAQPSLPTSNGGDTLLKQGHITPPLTQSGSQAGNSSPASPVPMSSSGTAFRFNASITNKMLDMSYRNLSHPLDCEKAKPYLPPNPYRTMSFYPQEPHLVLSTPDLFHKLDADTLFFIFYYQQATYQQYLAALELKRQSWRYHKKYLTWFQRQEKPLQVTEDFEEGKYIYFDYESGWSARSKQDFTFKYTYLEDELV